MLGGRHTVDPSAGLLSTVWDNIFVVMASLVKLSFVPIL